MDTSLMGNLLPDALRLLLDSHRIRKYNNYSFITSLRETSKTFI